MRPLCFLALNRRSFGMGKNTVFYSWRDDPDRKLNRHFIQKCLEEAIKKVNREDLSDLVVDRDTKNVAGMPDIGRTVMEKIDMAAVVVADLTIINPAWIRRDDERPVSNPNVLFELGYALGKRGHARLVGVVNLAFGPVDELPFDIRPKRLMTYCLKDGDDTVAVQKELVSDLAKAIRLCLGETEAEQIQRNTRIKQVIVDMAMVGPEIDDWLGIPGLPRMLTALHDAIKELCDLMAQAGYPQGTLNLATNMLLKMEAASRASMNEENWSGIRQQVQSAGELAGFVNSRLTLRCDSQTHDRLLDKIRAMPVQLNQQAEAILSRQGFDIRTLEDLTKSLRDSVFMSVLPEHPGFTGALNPLSLEMRRYFLGKVKTNPVQMGKEDAAVLKDFGNRLIEIVAKYCPSGFAT
jgi:hypothetical protein